MVDNGQKANSRVGALTTIELCLLVLPCQDTQSATSETSTSTSNYGLGLRRYKTLPDFNWLYSPWLDISKCFSADSCQEENIKKEGFVGLHQQQQQADKSKPSEKWILRQMYDARQTVKSQTLYLLCSLPLNLGFSFIFVLSAPTNALMPGSLHKPYFSAPGLIVFYCSSRRSSFLE